MAKILVTGGAGFIGSHVARALVGRGHDVTVLDDLSGGYTDNVPAEAQFVRGSITDAPLIATMCEEERFTYIYHLAAYAAEGLSHFIRRFNYTNNLTGSINLINAAVNTGVECFVFTSSIAVYGPSPELPMTEQTPAHPEDPYGIAKLAVEMDLQAAHHMFGLNSVIFRPHNVYGEGQNIADRYRNVVGIFMNQILQDQPMSVFGDGEQQRAFSYIGDIAPIMADAIETPAAWNQIFNVGADTPFTVNALAQAVARAMGVAPEIRHLPARQEVFNAWSSHAAVRRVFGERPQHSLDEGLARMATWVRAHGARASQGFEEVEVWKNFPKAWQATVEAASARREVG